MEERMQDTRPIRESQAASESWECQCMRKMQRAGTSRTIQSINDSKIPTIMICEVSDIGAREPTGHVLPSISAP